MKLNKYKARLMRFSNDDIAILLYPQRKARPLFILGFIDNDGLFEFKSSNVYRMSTRDYLKKDKFHPKKDIDMVNFLSGSVKTDNVFQRIIELLTKRASYGWIINKQFDSRLDSILLLEYIKKHGKFYGKKEKIFERRKKSAQDII